MNLDKPLTAKILSDPCHAITQHIIYLYTMESFIYSDLNKAIRDKDVSKIRYYGAYSSALSYILYSANKRLENQAKLQGNTVVYRGLKMTDSEVAQY